MRGHGHPVGYMVHSTLMVDADSGEIFGLIDQQRWLREKVASKTNQDNKPGEKESQKWHCALEATRERVPDHGSVITVADREADIFEVLDEHDKCGARFVIRSRWNRKKITGMGRIHDEIRRSKTRFMAELKIEQRGAQAEKANQKQRAARKREVKKVKVQAMTATLSSPGSTPVEEKSDMTVNVVRISESGSDVPKRPLEWILVTQEPIETDEQISAIIKAYEMRWKIEEFHKAWKTGCRVEERPLHTYQAVEKMMAITAAVAIRLMQLHEAANSGVDVPASRLLSEPEENSLDGYREVKAAKRSAIM